MKDSELNDELVKVKLELKNIQNEFGEFILNKFKNLYKEFPEDLYSFSWLQFTPYFNDGEECVYNVYDDPDSFNVKLKSLGEIDYYNLDEEKNKDIINFLNSFSDILYELDNEILKLAFGDHVEICIKHNGDFEINEYVDHH